MPRLSPSALALALVVALPAAAKAQISADVPETHTVKQGDTLWDLSRQYFSDPLLWPRIYQMNTGTVEDPHWIYPGEVLRLKSDVAVSSVPVSGDTVPVAAPTDSAVAIADPVPGDTMSREAAVEEPVAETVQAPASSDTGAIFPRPGQSATVPEMMVEFRSGYRAVNRAEFFQAGFMTEGKSWPFGTILGTTSPSQVAAVGSQTAYLYSKVIIEQPTPGAYQVGDTLLAVEVSARSFGSFGSPVTPVGLVRVTDASRPRVIGEVIAQYADIPTGIRVLAAERYTERRGVHAQPVADGIEGALIGFRSTATLHGLGDIGFIDRGRNDGITVGDEIEAHRTERPRETLAVVVPDVVARLQVVHVGDRSSTVRVIWVAHPDIPVNTRWKLVARLPG